MSIQEAARFGRVLDDLDEEDGARAASTIELLNAHRHQLDEYNYKLETEPNQRGLT